MNGSLRTILAASIAAMAMTGVARAADVPIVPYVEPVPVGGWYLRGYIGMSNQQLGKLDNVLFTPGTVEFLDSGGFDAAPIYGIGVGYEFNEWFRADLTGEYRGKASFTALDRYDFNGDNIWDGSNDYSANKYEWLLMANAYVDLGTWWGITPYVGGGIGASRNTISNFQDINTPNGGVAYAPSASKWNFAWALHAGAGWEVTQNVTVDLGYRYVDLGDGETGDIVGYNGLNTVNNPMIFDSLTSHDVHLGVRYAFQ
ncbi:outer membrane protein [Microbaculum marinisediminis]|uniref:Porin family protein n=1 Tax=Microbaculum marinisediminis TaxID=2931392 RepID=A0AAW5QV33_9HYPH|nr:outer membrane protein [Microbaculum sp. A6E488]MCT8971747.1 porin family protein [Microbaculum sp. A6E488]